MTSDNISHKEAILTREFTEWFKKNRNYSELYEDVRTSGDPFDSAGFIGDELVLIEFKNAISKSMVYYEGSTGSSIERKIGQVLNEIYRQKGTNIFNAIKNKYNEFTIPTLIIVVNRISESALEMLREMMGTRCNEWRFNYNIIIWDREKPKREVKGKCNMDNSVKNTEIVIPNFPNTAPKRTNYLNPEKVSKILTDKNLNEIWIDFKHFAENIGFKITYQAQNVGFINTQTNHMAIGVWPRKSSREKGLRMSFSIEQLNQINPKIKSFADLGIERSKSKLGFLGYNGYIANIKELQQLKRKIVS